MARMVDVCRRGLLHAPPPNIKVTVAFLVTSFACREHVDFRLSLELRRMHMAQMHRDKVKSLAVRCSTLRGRTLYR